jgi:urease accessory protein
MLPTLQAIWQADGTFPSGSFAFSYGVEGVVALRPDLNTSALAELTTAVVRQRWVTCDRVALVRAFRAAGDLDAIAGIDRDVEASTFGSTMRDGSRRNGGSFLASHARLGEAMALRLREAVRSGACLGHIAVMQGAVWQTMGLDEKLAQLASAYSVASGVVAAAVRLGAIGALEGQKVLRGCLPLIETLVAQPVPDDAGLSSFIPFLEIAAARHTRADLRLFVN